MINPDIETEKKELTNDEEIKTEEKKIEKPKKKFFDKGKGKRPSLPKKTRPSNKKTTKKPKEPKQPKKDLGFDPSREFAPVPDDNPEQQRAICMVKGKLLIVDAKKNRGVLQINKDHYPCTFLGKLKPEKMVKKVNKELSFTGWPTGIVETTKKGGQLPLILLQLSSFRKDVVNNGFCEVRGIVANASNQKFQMRVHSPTTQDTYTINVYGKCPAKNGEFIKIEADLTPKGLKMRKWSPIKLD